VASSASSKAADHRMQIRPPVPLLAVRQAYLQPSSCSLGAKITKGKPKYTQETHEIQSKSKTQRTPQGRLSFPADSQLQ